ncbi:MAG TPA: sigma-54 dependent transcriptional regulator [Candidatus Acidoferrales bacterium]|nr:sigma-54 dependent transcriptional regulator [Candidatus Acidoferrales bacterium]
MGNSVVTSIRANLPVRVVDRHPDDLERAIGELQKYGFQVIGTADPRQALRDVAHGDCRVVLADFETLGIDGLTFLDKVLEYDPGVCVILIGGPCASDSAIAAIKRGAYDCVCKPLDVARVATTLDDLAGVYAQRSEVRALQEKLFDNMHCEGILGKSPAMIDVFDMVRRVSRHYTNVLITGPAGAGKGTVARALHQLSPVAQERFAVCNCSASSDALLELQTFGHAGDSAGVTESTAGWSEFAKSGTIFLDEVGEASPATQGKLLRAVQNREIRRVGAWEVEKADVRIVAATHRDLRADVLAGRFLENLYDELSGIEIRVPGLSERRDDIPVLIQHFLKRCNRDYGTRLQGLTRRAQIALTEYDWPGNVRELENVIAGAAFSARADFIDESDLPARLRKPHASAAGPPREWQPLPLNEVRRVHIQRVLETCNGNRVRAAQLLGIGRTSLYRFLKRSTKQTATARGSA